MDIRITNSELTTRASLKVNAEQDLDKPDQTLAETLKMYEETEDQENKTQEEG